MKRLLMLIQVMFFVQVSGAQEGHFQMSQIGANNLFNGAWQITWGSDDYLWVSERIGKNIYRVNPTTGSKDLLLHFDPAIQDQAQNGLLGFAIHPEIGQSTGKDYLFVSYTYLDGGTRKQKIVRLTYSLTGNDGTLHSEIDILTGLPSSNDHNSGRLVFGPDGKLYYSIGDQGSNRGGNACKPILSQVLPSQAEIDRGDFSYYPGKTLRINLDGSIPEDNPLLEGVRSHIYTYGHRNHQGLVFSDAGVLYSDEHGDNTDDEINLLQSGKNYGWPHVAGYQDDKVYRYCNYSSIEDCTSSMWHNYTCNSLAQSSDETDWSHPDFTPPVATLFTVDNGYDFFSSSCPSDWICRPNVAPSSLDFYGSYEKAIPGWENSLLVISLKRGRIYRYQISEDGLSVNQDYTEHWNTINRYRDIAVHPNGRDFFVITDNAGGTEAADGLNRTSNLANPGALLKFTFVLDSELDTDNSLSSLSVAPGELVPVFDPNITEYSIQVPEGTTSLDISAQANSSSATVKIGAFRGLPGYDKIIVTAENGSKREYTINVTIRAKVVLSSDELNKLDISIGPNPVSHHLQLKSEAFSGIELLSVFDLSGKTINVPIIQYSSGHYEIEMNSLMDGVYILKLNVEGLNYSYKIFKK